MAFDLARLKGEHRRWVRVGLDDMEVEIRHAGPAAQEKFRQRMVAAGILKHGESGIAINVGRTEAFFHEYAKQHVTGWRNLILNGKTDPEFDASEMGKILEASGDAFSAVAKAVGEEADFFSVNGAGSIA